MGLADDALNRDQPARAERREPVGYSGARLLSLATPAFAYERTVNRPEIRAVTDGRRPKADQGASVTATDHSFRQK
jgi:hypothetical protein